MSHTHPFLFFTVAPEKEKFSHDDNRHMSLPEGIQEIFTPGEADDAAMAVSPAASSPAAASTSAASAPVSKEETLQRAVEEDLLKRAVDSITGLVGSEPIMAPGSPQRIMEESRAAPISTTAPTPAAVPAKDLSLSLSPLTAAVPAEELSLSLSPTTENVGTPPIPVVPGKKLSTDLPMTPAGATVTPPTFSENSPSGASAAGTTTTTVVLLETLSRPSPWTMRPRTTSLSGQPLHPLVGTVRPGPPPEPSQQESSGLLLHDFRPADMMSRYVPAHVEVPHSFHNILSSVFVDNVPCAQKGLLKAMALSLEDRQIPVLHGIDLPPDQGLLPDDLFHMGTYLYVGALFEEFEDHWQAALKSRSDVQCQLSQDREKLRLCQDQLQSLREVNSLLAKSNSPAEREQIIRLQQECRKSSQSLQEVTHDYQELKAFSVNLQQQLMTAEEQRASASLEAQETHEKLKLSAAELSKLKVRVISMSEPPQKSADEDELKMKVEAMALELKEKQQLLDKAEEATKAALVHCAALEQEKKALIDSNAETSLSLKETETEIKALKTARTELTVQVKELSKERDNAAPLLSDARIRAKSHQAELASMQEEKKALLHTVAAKDERINSLTCSVDNLTKDKKKSSVDTTKELDRARETIASLNQDKTKMIRDIKEDGLNFLALQSTYEKQEGLHAEALRISKDKIAQLEDAAAAQLAVRTSLEDQLNISANKILDLDEQLKSTPVADLRNGKESYKKLKRMYDQVRQLLEEPETSGDTSSGTNSDDELEEESGHHPAKEDSPSREHRQLEPEPEKKRTYSDAAQMGTGSSRSPQGEPLELSLRPEERLSVESRKRDRSDKRISSNPRSRKKSRSGSSERHVRYAGSPPRRDKSASAGRTRKKSEVSPPRSQERRPSPRQHQRETQLHYDLDYMDEDLHQKAFGLIKRYTAESVEAIFNDADLIRFLRGPASIRDKNLTVQKLLKGYARCTSLEDLALLNEGTPPPEENAFQPLPDLSPGSDEWKFVQSIVQNNFVHFPSLMGLYRLFSSKTYAFFHYGKKADPECKKNTISLLYTADKDSDNMKRSDWEKKLDLLLVLVTSRLVFYTLDQVSPFDCNPDRILHLRSSFLTDDYMEEMINTRSYSDPYLLPRKTMYFLYTECHGTKARRDFNHRIARYEPPSLPDRELSVPKSSSAFSWMNQ